MVRHREVQVSVGIGACVFVLRNQFKASEMGALKVLFEGSFGEARAPQHNWSGTRDPKTVSPPLRKLLL